MCFHLATRWLRGISWSFKTSLDTIQGSTYAPETTKLEDQTQLKSISKSYVSQSLILRYKFDFHLFMDPCIFRFRSSRDWSDSHLGETEWRHRGRGFLQRPCWTETRGNIASPFFTRKERKNSHIEVDRFKYTRMAFSKANMLEIEVYRRDAEQCIGFL